LSGFRSLDEREDRYKEAREVIRTVKAKKPVTRPSSSKNFFNDILTKTKSLLIDDLNDKNEY
ncbi:MAG: cell division protein FtsA, partial [Cytophagia bacterium]|nr:cell division protein FtsA [Cytophagia bacterium]